MMIKPIKPADSFSIKPLIPLKGSEEKEITGGNSFVELLKKGIDEVNQKQLESDQVTRDFALGKIDNIHQVTIAAEEASLALNLTTAIQNKVVDAYKEIMRMQI